MTKDRPIGVRRVGRGRPWARRVRRIGCAVAALLGPAALAAQGPIVGIGYGHGSAIEQLGLGPTLGADAVRTLSLEVGWRMWGETGWRRDYQGPVVGFGLQRPVVSGRIDFGSPLAAYGFFHWPVVERRRVDLRLDLSGGLAGGWAPFDATTNPDQRAIGSSLTALLQIGATTAVQVSERWGVSAGLSAAHFSNGALAQPNGGLTVISPVVGLEYALGRARVPADRRPLYEQGDGGVAAPAAPAPPAWGWRARLYGGIKTVRVEGPARAYTHRSSVQGVTLASRRRLGRNLSLLTSADAVLDHTGGRPSTVAPETPLAGLGLDERLSLGASLGLDWAIGRVHLETSWGATLWRRDLGDQVRRRYEKFGASFRARPNLEVGLVVRSSRGISDFVEVGVAWVR